MFCRILLCIVLFGLASLLISCGREGQKPGARYGIIVFAGEEEDEEYILPTNSLTSGAVSIPEKAERIYSLISACRNGYYFGIDDGKPKFTRYIPTENGLVTDVEIPFHHADWKPYESWYNWLDDRTILLGSTMEGRRLTYNIIDTQAMTIRAQGNFEIPKLADSLFYGGVVGEFRENRLFISYTVHAGWQNDKPASDTTFLAVVEYPSMKTLAVQKDTRSTWPGGLYLHAPFSFIDNGDIYFLAAPGGRTHPHPTAPAGIYRIRKDEEKLDSTYFFAVADPKTEEGYMLYGLGQGKALVKIVRKNRIRQYMDYLDKHVAEYYLLDLRAQTRSRLNLPLDRLNFTENVLVENGKAYIAVCEKKNESYIWEYTLATGALKRGLKVEGRALVLNRLLPD